MAEMPEVAEAIEQYGNFVTIPQAIGLMGCGRKTLQRLINRGEITLYRLGSTRAYRLRTVDVMNLFRVA